MSFTKGASFAVGIVASLVTIIFAVVYIYALWRESDDGGSVMEHARSILRHHDRITDPPKAAPRVTPPVIPANTTVRLVSGPASLKRSPFSHIRRLCSAVQDPAFAEQCRLAQVENCLFKIRRYLDIIGDLKKQQRNAPKKQLINNISSTNKLAQTIDVITRVLQDVISRHRRLQNPKATRRVNRDLMQIVTDEEKGFASLTGRQDFMNFVAGQILSFVKSPALFNKTMQNIVLMGPSGIGKTRLAQTLAFAYNRAGILTRDTFTVGTKKDLVSQYVSETSQVAFFKLAETLESVFLLDEAYEMGSGQSYRNGADHGGEALTEVVNFMDKFAGCSIIIAAGYEGAMREKFFAANEGLNRRFPHQMVLSPYKTGELTAILINALHDKLPAKMRLSPADQSFLAEIMVPLANSPDVAARQAGEIEIVAGYIAANVLASDASWDRESRHLIAGGVDQYLSFKGMRLAFSDGLS